MWIMTETWRLVIALVGCVAVGLVAGTILGAIMVAGKRADQ